MTPDTIHDEVVGEMFYDPPLREWWAKVALTPEHQIEVTIWWDETKDGPFAPILDRARTACQRFFAHEPEHRHALAVALVEYHQTGWSPDEDVLDSREAAGGLTASQMSIGTDGSARVIYDDAAELFGDHDIVARISSDGTFADFELHG